MVDSGWSSVVVEVEVVYYWPEGMIRGDATMWLSTVAGFEVNAYETLESPGENVTKSSLAVDFVGWSSGAT